MIGDNLIEQLIYLLEICMCDDDFDDRELMVIGETASHFGYNAEQFKNFVKQVKDV